MFEEIPSPPPENSGESKNSFHMGVQYIYFPCCLGVCLVKLLCELGSDNNSNHCSVIDMEQTDMCVYIDMYTKPAFTI